MLEPNIISASCSQLPLYRDFDIVSANGSCTSRDKCTVNTTIIVHYVEDFATNFVGSMFMTCTEDGWFPPEPNHETCRQGKSKKK